MRFLLDRCAGVTLARWLREQQHDVAEARDRGPDPGDLVLLEWAHAEGRVLITNDKDFGELVFLHEHPHGGFVRLPDVPAQARIDIMRQLLANHSGDLVSGAIITVRGGRIRITRQTNN